MDDFEFKSNKTTFPYLKKGLGKNVSIKYQNKIF